MSMTNAQRTKLISAINGADVRIIAIANGLLDAIDLKRFLPPAVDGLLHRHVATFFLYRPNDGGNSKDSLTASISDGGKKIYAIGFSSDAVDRGPYYLVMLLTRELARVVCDAEHMTDHEDRRTIYQNYEKYLVMLINEHTGTDITDESNYNPPTPKNRRHSVLTSGAGRDTPQQLFFILAVLDDFHRKIYT